DAALEGPVLAQAGDDAGHRGVALADGAVDADDAAVALPQQGVHGDRGLAGLAVAENELALSPADRDRRVDGLDARLERHRNRRAGDDARRGALDRKPARRSYRALLVDGTAGAVEHPAEQLVAHSDIENAPRRIGGRARRKVRVGPEQRHTDRVGV